ncbi:MAG TPA: YciI family protein [Chthoniobacterales bacterium]|nr:YciI family protein [Chthoniobacterales bacterium]
MSTQTTTAEYLVICRGVRFDESLSPGDIQNAMKQYHAWFERLIYEGKSKSGRQLAPEGKIFSARKGVTDGPFAESKEGIAGYWFIQAASLEEAVEIAKGDPLRDYGHTIEIRPILPEAAKPQIA